MYSNASDAYLETQVFTATPQRLRLMLIDGAIRRAHAAQEALASGDAAKAMADIGRCRDIVAELIAGITPEQTPITGQILSVYMFLYSTLVEISIGKDFISIASESGRIADILRVLEEERQTWREVCEKMPERLVPAANSSLAEELAPSRVADNAFTTGYIPAPNMHHHRASAFSLDA